jgi:hypothetical protein
MTQVSQTEVDEALRNVDDLIDRIGDQVTGSRNEQADGNAYTIREAQHGDHGYQVIASPSIGYLELRSGFNAVEALAKDMAVANARSGGQVQVSDRVVNSARRTVKEQSEDVDQQAVEDGLYRRASQNGVAIDLDSQDGVLTAFIASTKLFVYDEELSPSEFNQSVQSVINATVGGRAYLINEYDLAAALDDAGSDPNRGFA